MGGADEGARRRDAAPVSGAIRPILDKLTLHELVLTYCRAVDRRDLALLATLYHEDAIDDHGGMFCGSARDYIAWLPSMLAHFEATRHDITNALFAIEGDEADGELYTIAYHRTHGPEAREIIVGGRYLDRYQRRGGVWRFLYRSLVFDWKETRPTAWAGGENVSDGVAHGRADGEDPSYQRLPLFARERHRWPPR